MDPVYAALFRPDDPAPAVAAPPDDEPPPEDESPFQPIVDPVVDPRIEDLLPDTGPDAEPPTAVPDAPSIVDTGRLFRSRGVLGHDEAVLALSSDHFGRLRTLERRDEATPQAPAVIPIGGVVADAGPAKLDDGAGSPAGDPGQQDGSAPEGGRTTHRSRQITGGAVYIIVIGVTVLVGFANALISDGDIGWPTGLALLASTVYSALTVRRSDDVVAIIAPPLAFVLAAMTAGQLLLGSAEGSILNRAVIVFFTLADNWAWIIGSTAAALVIVLVRRRRG
jgi:hypothetical protein